MSTSLRSLISTRDLDLEMVEHLFSRALSLKRLRGVLSAHEKSLNGDTVVTLFWESSTRTRVSFELAAHRLGAHVVNLVPRDADVAKGESLEDTVANLRAIGCRFFVVRHADSGEVERLARQVGRGIYLINAGDGTNEHPSQALLDALTIRERAKTLNGLQMAIVGDVLRSRVAHSHLNLMPKLGVRIRVAGPKELMPPKLDTDHAVICPSVDEALRGADVVMVLRLQRERAGIHFTMSPEEYRKEFGITAQRLGLAKPDAMVLHPGPVMRNQELDSEVVDGAQSLILRQVENGLFMRMAIFEALRGDLG